MRVHAGHLRSILLFEALDAEGAGGVMAFILDAGKELAVVVLLAPGGGVLLPIFGRRRTSFHTMKGREQNQTIL